MQMDLFDRIQCGAEPVVVPKAGELDPRLHDFALLYTGTEKGNNSGIRFALSREDAVTWCESPISRGVLHGTEWAYFWTSAFNFISCHWGPKEPKIIIKGLVDNGRWDDRIASLGLRKIGFPDFQRVFGPLGVEVVG